MSALFDAYVEAKEFETYYNSIKKQVYPKEISTVAALEQPMHLSFDDLNIDSGDAIEDGSNSLSVKTNIDWDGGQKENYSCIESV